jgi:hypothetical protein
MNADIVAAITAGNTRKAALLAAAIDDPRDYLLAMRTVFAAVQHTARSHPTKGPEMDTEQIEIPTVVGTATAGGFYAGRFRIGEQLFALVVAPKAAGEHDDTRWNKSSKDVAAAKSFCDGHANTLAMAEAGSALARWALELRIADYGDWYVPSRDELELLYRSLKPGADSNYGYRSGDNPSSVPPGYPYSSETPGQTGIQAFRGDGAEAFDEVWYWSSTQYAGDAGYAWFQHFRYGYQSIYYCKSSELRARAVRRVPIQ